MDDEGRGTVQRMTQPRPRILIVGGGYVGLYTALRLQRKLRDGEATVTVVEPNSYMTYEPFLPECAAGSLEPRHVVVPLRRVLKKCRIVSGWVRRLSHERRLAHVEPIEGPGFDIPYDILVMCPGSISRTMPIPGLVDIGVGVKSVGEATYLRNKVISQMDAAASTDDEELRRRALTFLFVGAGYAGIETFAELADMAFDSCKWYPSIEPSDMRWVMVEASDHILPEVSPSLSLYTMEQLRHRGMEIHLNTRLSSIVGGHAVLDNGIEFDTDTVAWTAGVRAHPLIENGTDLPVDDHHRLKATAFLQVDGVEDAWTAGDGAAVPDLARGPGAFCGPTAQHAVRQARRLGSNVIAELRGRPLTPYEHANAGSVASLGLYKGVAEIYGVKVRGFPAWFMHRTYHVSRVPTLNRKSRVVADWTLALFFPRDIAALGALSTPRSAFVEAAGDWPRSEDAVWDEPVPRDSAIRRTPERAG